MNIIWGDGTNPALNRALGLYVDERIGGSGRSFGNSVTMGIVNGSDLVAAAVFHNYEPKAGVIEISAASDSKLWMTRPVLNRMFSYVFGDAGCQMCVMRVSAKNLPMCRMAKAYGFKGHLIPRLRGREEDEFVFTLTDDDWKSNKFNRKEVGENGKAKSTQGP
ncbi:GNAT family N-acetyltransferase [Erwinia amylovora]|uniref:GNAT family N-acetyltransferase n=1 Tax=Erwinia amylovora TaxID=552 RepID=UPI003CFDED65